MDGKKVCEYGMNCYRKNPAHFEEYTHCVETDQPKGNGVVKRRRKDSSPKKVLKQTKLDFFQRTVPVDKAPEGSGRPKTASAEVQPKRRPTTRRRKPVPVAKTVFEESSEAESENENGGVCDVTSNSWVFQGSSSEKNSEENLKEDTSNMTPAEKIKKIFLVEMPQDFYTFYEFCESIKEGKPTEALRDFGLRLVGPFDVLLGALSPGSVSAEEGLTHWRFFMDPPEFQTVLIGEKGLHFGYWRDDPQTKETFIASNTVPDCKIKPEAPTIFAAVLHYLENFARACSPFDKVKAGNLIAKLKEFADSKAVDLSSNNDAMTQRKKNVVARTFNEMGIVVPYDKKTDVGYRPILQSNANLKKICQAAIKANNSSSPHMEEIEGLINAANIANDESDFGNGLELGLDLFCMGSDIFNDFVEHLLTTAYSLLKRPEWAEIIKAHLKNRRTGLELSVLRK